MKLLIVIVGAGATADSTLPSTFGDENRPPLTNDLVTQGRYQGTIANWRPVGGLIGTLRDRLRALSGSTSSISLEAELRKIAGEASGSLPVRRQLLAFRYYVQDIMGGVSRSWYRAHDGALNAAWLVNELGRWQDRSREPIAYISFNYDTILDNALADWYGWSWYQRDSLTLDAYVRTGNPFSLFKPHGSWNWAQLSTLGVDKPLDQRQAYDLMQTSDILFEFGEARLYPELDTEPLSPNLLVGAMQRYAPGQLAPVAPALALPLADKTKMVISTAHQQELFTCLRAASGVLMIGWHAGEDYVRKLLRDTVPAGTSFALVSPNAVDNADRIKGDLESPDMLPIGKGFAALREGGDLEDALRQMYAPD